MKTSTFQDTQSEPKKKKPIQIVLYLTVALLSLIALIIFLTVLFLPESKTPWSPREGPDYFTDSDNDNLSDFEEQRIGTSPQNPDTDGDGYLDGQEVASGYNPLIPAPQDKVVFEDPRLPEIGTENPQLQVTKVSFRPKDKTILIEGRALPNSFVVIHVFSQPLVFITKSDLNGNWSYIIEDLADGQHKVYVSITDSSGKILEKSPLFAFVKEAEAVSVITSAQEKAVPTPFYSALRLFVICVLVVMAAAMIIVLLIIFIFLRREKLT